MTKKKYIKVKKYKKKTIPKAVREQVWIKYCGRRFTHKCYVGVKIELMFLISK